MKLKELAATIYIDPRKLTHYALCSDNPKGKHKALIFRSRLGFTPENYQPLLKQIQDNALDAEAKLKEKDQYGQRYQVDLTITGIDPNQTATVRTGWLIAPNSNQARLVTAYTLK